MRHAIVTAVVVLALGAASTAFAKDTGVRVSSIVGIGSLSSEVAVDPYDRGPGSYGGFYSVLGIDALMPVTASRYGSILGIHLAGDMRFFGSGVTTRSDESFGELIEGPGLLFMEMGLAFGLVVDVHRTERLALGFTFDGVWDMAFYGLGAEGIFGVRVFGAWVELAYRVRQGTTWGDFALFQDERTRVSVGSQKTQFGIEIGSGFAETETREADLGSPLHGSFSSWMLVLRMEFK